MSRLHRVATGLPRILVQIAVWPILGILTIAFDDLGPSLAPSLPPGSEYYVFLQWGLLTPFVLFLARRFSLVAGRPRNLAIHSLAALSLCALRMIEEPHRLAVAARVSAAEYLARAVSRDLLVYASIVTAAHLFLLARRRSAAEHDALLAEANAVQAERKLLEKALSPVVIARSLDEIARRIRCEPERVQPLIDVFGDFLRSRIPRHASGTGEPPVEISVDELERELGAHQR